MTINKEFLQRESNITAKVVCDSVSEAGDRIKGKVKVGDVFSNNSNNTCVVVDYRSALDVVVMFQDKLETTKSYAASKLRSGSFRNPNYPSVLGVGFIGQGKYKPTCKGVKLESYELWRAMINRCYSAKKHLTHKNYKDCTVCEDWHNFQVFAKWYDNQKFKGFGYQLDKDILVKGNRVYSPENCCLVPQEINSVFAPISSKTTVGVSKAETDGKFIARVFINNKSIHLVTFETEGRALSAYKNAKLSNIKEVAKRWRNLIDESVYVKLMEWEL